MSDDHGMVDTKQMRYYAARLRRNHYSEGALAMEQAADKIERLTKQRDDLLAAASQFVFDFDTCRSSGEWPVESMRKLRAAIAAAKEKP